MRRTFAAIGSVVFFCIAPGFVVGLVPWWLTRWEWRTPLPFWAPLRVLGVVLLMAGLAVLVHAFVRFVVEGLGTPAPIAPTVHLVVGGLYRYVRNPMYVALVLAITGQALLLGQLHLLWYTAFVWLVTAAFVLVYEEPALHRQFGAEYDAYRRAVPAWWPRLHPWRGTGAGTTSGVPGALS
jgi:protein-S-isoprenylcysteine O-methyltransferase Ste14